MIPVEPDAEHSKCRARARRITIVAVALAVTLVLAAAAAVLGTVAWRASVAESGGLRASHAQRCGKARERALLDLHQLIRQARTEFRREGLAPPLAAASLGVYVAACTAEDDRATSKLGTALPMAVLDLTGAGRFDELDELEKQLESAPLERWHEVVPRK